MVPAQWYRCAGNKRRPQDNGRHERRGAGLITRLEPPRRVTANKTLIENKHSCQRVSVEIQVAIGGAYGVLERASGGKVANQRAVAMATASVRDRGQMALGVLFDILWTFQFGLGNVGMFFQLVI